MFSEIYIKSKYFIVWAYQVLLNYLLTFKKLGYFKFWTIMNEVSEICAYRFLFLLYK